MVKQTTGGYAAAMLIISAAPVLLGVIVLALGNSMQPQRALATGVAE
jgi:hypothetical protein